MKQTETAASSLLDSLVTSLEFSKSKKIQGLHLNYGRLLLIGQVALDWVTVFACYMASYWIYTRILSKSSPQPLGVFASMSVGIALAYVLILDWVGLYRREASLLNIKELRSIFRSSLYAAAVILSFSFYIRVTSLSRMTFTAAILLTPMMLILQRQLYYKLQVKFHQQGWAQKRVFIFGAGSIGTQLARRMFESPSLGLLPVGFLDDEKEKQGKSLYWNGIGPRKGLQVLGGEEILQEWRKYDVELVVISLPSAKFDRNQKLVELCVAAGIDYFIVPNAYEKFIQNVELFEVGGIPLLRKRERHATAYYRTTKRVIDFVLSSFFILLLSPLLIFFALAIKFNSPGPVIFKQKRVGFRGREFSFYKFRTMHVDAPKYARSPANPKDPRITKIGRWLRRTSLDELPQLFNVYRGDMSLVGPRPEMPFVVAKYTTLEQQRLEAKPGITGVWQISSVRGEPIHMNLEYDLFYLENRSILLDFAIILKTILSVVRGIGAI